MPMTAETHRLVDGDTDAYRRLKARCAAEHDTPEDADRGWQTLVVLMFGGGDPTV